MYFNKLLLKDFGKFHNREIELKPGVNIIYGEKGAGKTTMKDFMTAMFYGVDSAKGLSDGQSGYALHKPEQYTGYDGKAYLRDGEDTYLLERSFSRHNNKLIALNIRTGRELKTDRRLGLVSVLFDTDKNTYENVCCISAPAEAHRGETPAAGTQISPVMQHISAPTATTDVHQSTPTASTGTAQTIASDLDAYLTRLTTTGTPDIDRDDVLKRLRKTRRRFDIRPYEAKLSKLEAQLEGYSTVDDELSDIRAQIKEVDEEFAIETARRKREARKLIETDEGTDYEDDDELIEGLDALAKTSTFLDTDMHEAEKPKKPLNERWWYIALNAAFVIAVITVLVNIMPFEHAVRQLFEVCTVLLVAVTIVEGLYANGVLEKNDEYTPSEDDFKQVIYELERKTEAYQDVEIDMSFASEYMDQKAKLKEKEHALLARIEERQALEAEQQVCNDKLTELKKELHAINLAMNTIMDISAEIHSQLGGIINGHISDMVTSFTGGRYTDVSWDNKNHILVYSGDKAESIYNIEERYLKQINLAVRLCVAREMNNDKLPIIIDCALDDIDPATREAALQYIENLDTDQIIIFTSKYMGENKEI